MDGEINVLHVISLMSVGGAQTLIKELFEFQKDNKNIFLYSLRKTETDVKVDHRNVYSCNDTSPYSFRPLFELRKIIRDRNIKILHCHLYKAQIFGFLIKLLFFPEIKLILHEHGNLLHSKKRLHNILIRLYKKSADLFLVVSKKIKNKLMEYGIDESNIKILYSFINLDKYDKKNIKIDIKKKKEEMGIEPDDYVIGFSGRLCRVKGCEYLIRSLPSIDFKHKVLIAGEGELRHELENLANELSVRDRVKFLGYRSNMLDIYPLFDVLVVPSLSEGSPLSPAEAQALGIPVVGADVNGINEFLIHKENGLLFEAKNEKDLADKLNLLYNDISLKDRLIRNGLENIKNYSLHRYMENLNNIYREVLDVTPIEFIP